MTTQSGETEPDRQSKADVFATFYGKLYKRRTLHDNMTNNPRHDDNHHSHHGDNDSESSTITEFTAEELHKAMFQLCSGKCKDTAGILAEMIKAGAKPIDEAPRPGSRGTTVAFIHPKGSFGTLIELVQE